MSQDKKISQDKKTKRKPSEQNNPSNVKIPKLQLQQEAKILSKIQQTNQDKKIFFSTKKEAKSKLDQFKVGDQVTVILSAMDKLETYPDICESTHVNYPVDAVITGMRFDVKKVTMNNISSEVATRIITVKLLKEIKVPIVEKTMEAGVFEAFKSNTTKVFLKDQEFDLFVGEREWCLDCYKNKYCGKCKLNLPFKIPYIVAKSNAKFDCRNNLYFPDHCEYFYFSLDL